MKRLSGLLLVSCALLLALPSCDDECPTRPSTTGTVQGRVVLVRTGEPVVGARLVLVDGRSNAPASSVVTTDSQGAYRIRGVKPGSYYLFILTRTMVLFDQTAIPVSVEAGQVTYHDVRMLTPSGPAPAYYIRGTVRDGETGRPLAGAYVCASHEETLRRLFEGRSTGFEAVTGRNGGFAVDAITVRATYRDSLGEILGLRPIIVSKEGYLEYQIGSIDDPIPIPTPPNNVVTVDIRLQRGSGTSSIRGRVILRGEPKAGIVVGLDLMDMKGAYINPEKGPIRPVIVQGRTALTDEEGRFLFTGLPAGWYEVIPGYLPDDGFIPNETGSAVVSTGAEKDMGDMWILDAVRPVEPEWGAAVQDTTPTLRWRTVEGAASYEIWASIRPGGWYIYSTQDTFVTVPRNKPFRKGSKVRWMGGALDSKRRVVARTEVIWTFTVE